jgi:hypothetical protein
MGRLSIMGDVITAAMLDEMTPQERQAASEAATVRDLEHLPPYLQHLVDDARDWVHQREQRAAS